MVGIKHMTKRTLNRAKTTQKTIDGGLNQEFVDSRRRLHDIAGALRKMSKSVVGTRQIWLSVAKYQHDFANLLSVSFPEGGAVQAHAKEVEVVMRDLQVEINDDDESGSAHHRIVAVVDSYLELLNEIEREYKPVELACSEKIRYEHKVGKLEKKQKKQSGAAAAKKSKQSEKLSRNLEKLKDARDKLDEQTKKVTERMRDAFDKHQAVLQCAHHAFWMANDAFLKSIDETTQNIRAESVAVHERLLDVKVEEHKRLLPIPRQSVIEPVDHRQHHHQHTTTTTTTETQEEGGEEAEKDVKVEARRLSEPDANADADLALENIPAVPTERPSHAPSRVQAPAPATYTPKVEESEKRPEPIAA